MLREGTRLAYGTDVIDLGFRLEDVGGLQSEEVERKGDGAKYYLKHECGATDEECDFLVSQVWRGSWTGKRVELNAMTSEELISWLENKFQEHSIEKVIPDDDVLSETYKRAIICQKIKEKAVEIMQGISSETITIPEDLPERIKDKFESWNYIILDEAIWEIVSEN